MSEIKYFPLINLHPTQDGGCTCLAHKRYPDDPIPELCVVDHYLFKDGEETFSEVDGILTAEIIHPLINGLKLLASVGMVGDCADTEPMQQPPAFSLIAKLAPGEIPAIFSA